MSTGFIKNLSPPHEFPFQIKKNFSLSSSNPTLDLSGCVLWLDGQDIFGNGTFPIDGANVTSWYDKSGTGTEVVSYPTASIAVASEVIPPVYDGKKRGVFFNGNDASLKTNLSASETIETFFIVCEVSEVLNADGSSRNNILLGSQERGRTVFVSNGIYYITGGTSGDGSTVDVVFSSFPNILKRPIILVSTKNTQKIRNYLFGKYLQHYNSSGTFFDDGAPSFSYGLNCTTNISGYVTGDGTVQTIYSFGGFFGYVYEILVYHEFVNNKRREQIEAYLAKKWKCYPDFLISHPAKNQLNLESLLNYDLATQMAFKKSFSIKTLPNCTLWLDMGDSNSLYDNSTKIKDKSDKQYTILHSSGSFRTTEVNGFTLLDASITTQDYDQGYVQVNNFSLRSKFTAVFVAWGRFDEFWYLEHTDGTTNGITSYVQTRTDSMVGLRDGLRLRDKQFDENDIFKYVPKNDSLFIFIVGYNEGRVLNPFRLNGSIRESEESPDSNGQLPLNNDPSTNILRIAGWGPHGYLAEFIWYDRSLSNQECEKLEGYLAEKWKIQSELPEAHPYKNSPLFVIN